MKVIYEDKVNDSIVAKKPSFITNFKAKPTTMPSVVEKCDASGFLKLGNLKSLKSSKMLRDDMNASENESPGKRKLNAIIENEHPSQHFRRKIPKIDENINFSARFGMDPGEGGPATETADQF